MERGILTIYKASAGSGKTYCLTVNYLSRLFNSKNSFKKILAVTFTNKAAAEMKAKIISQLYSLSTGERTTMAADLEKATGKSFAEISSEAEEILTRILHEYSGFYVGTIDSFFQRILKAFTREIGLQQGYTIELDHSQILRQAVENLIEDSANDKTLTRWLADYIHNRTGEGKSWNLKSDIIKLAEEIFKEKFRLLTPTEKENLKNREKLTDYIKVLRSLRSEFESRLREYAAVSNDIIHRHNVQSNMFLRGDKGGVPSFIKLMAAGLSGIFKPLTATVSQVLDSPPVWTTKAGPSNELKAALDDGLRETITEAVHYYNNQYRAVNTAILILGNVYILGILADILEQVHIVTTSENKFLLSDAGELLSLIIGDDQTPFIYEKTGNAFEHLMIDEFQDTSHIQWSNFRPLIGNSMAEGNDNLVVGDVKQSIYRWRNSDWSILGTQIQEEIDEKRVKLENLETNWRSRKNIIAFNNTLFSNLPSVIDNIVDPGSEGSSLRTLYDDAAQKFPGGKEGGFIQIGFIGDTAIKNFEEEALSRLPGLIEELNDKGYSGSDIGILVRTNSEGANVLRQILDYQYSVDEEKKSKYNYNIISNESLLLSGSNAVNLILTFLSGLYSPDERLNKALQLRYLMLCRKADQDDFRLHQMDHNFNDLMPRGYDEFRELVRKLPLLSATERIIRFFDLGSSNENIAYLNTFQDLVLEFSGNNSSDVPSFLQWWETTGVKKAILFPDHRESMRVMTIHKAKGLEFRIVILPFVSWSTGHGRKNPVLWLRPAIEPFSIPGIVPIKYKADMQHSFFEADYKAERYSAAVDNLNLLYVAFTRAIDGLYCYCPSESGPLSIASALAATLDQKNLLIADRPSICLKDFYNSGENAFMYGNLPVNKHDNNSTDTRRIIQESYYTNNGTSRFNLRLHADKWLIINDPGRMRSLNYGKIMHRAFESVNTSDDVSASVNKLIVEGVIPESERDLLTGKIREAISDPVAGEWFKPGLKILSEADILLPSGSTKRPDRVIVEGEKTTVIDFKFGDEKTSDLSQVRQYVNLLSDMGYANSAGFLWYVDKKKIITV